MRIAGSETSGDWEKVEASMAQRAKVINKKLHKSMEVGIEEGRRIARNRKENQEEDISSPKLNREEINIPSPEEVKGKGAVIDVKC